MRHDSVKYLVAASMCAWAGVGCSGDSSSSQQTLATAPLAQKAPTRSVPFVRIGIVKGNPGWTVVRREKQEALAIAAADAGHKTMRDQLAAFVAKGPLTLILVDRPLTGGALAEVYLNGAAPLSRYMVVSRSQLHDEIIDRAHAFARQYEASNPDDQSPVKFTLTANGDYQRISAAGTFHGHQFFEGHYSRPDRRSRWLLQSAQRVPQQEVAGIGKARVLSLGTVPGK
jgi:hypothetical protein